MNTSTRSHAPHHRGARLAVVCFSAMALLVASPAHADSGYAPSVGCVKPPGQAHLFIYGTGTVLTGTQPSACKDSSCSPYTGSANDPWLQDSWYAEGGASVGLTIANEATQRAQSGVLLVIAIPGDTTALDFTSIELSGGDGGTRTIPFADFHHDHDLPFLGGDGQAGPHGVYNDYPAALYAYYSVGGIAKSDGGAGFGSVNLTVAVTGSGDSNLLIHFDAFSCVTGDITANSSDFNWIDAGVGCSLSMVCPLAQTVQCSGGGGLATLGTPSVSTTCGGDVAVTGPSGETAYAYTCPPATATVTSVTFDASVTGHTAACQTQVTVEDTADPMVGCGDGQTLVADASCHATAAAGVAIDACDGDVQTACNTVMAGTGSHTMTCTATDCAGNDASCTATITVVDETPPTLSCSADQTLECQGPAGTPATVGATGTDNCSGVTSTCDPGTGSFDYGSITVTCTGQDASGNGASCTSTVSIEDTTPPEIACPAPATVLTSSQGGVCELSATPEASAWDLCVGDVGAACSTLTLTAPGQATGTCSASDGHGNSTSCDATVTLEDDTPPEISCPVDQILECQGPCATVAVVEASATDNCGPVDASCNPGSGSYCLGTTNGTCGASDGWNTSVCQTAVTVVDTIPPALTCASSATVTTSSQDGICAASLPVSATATDVCDGALTASCDSAELSLAAPGTASATCSAHDASDNWGAPCGTTLTLVDDTPPGLSLGDPSGMPGEDGGFCNDAAVTLPFAASDNCDCPALVVSASLGTVSFDPTTGTGTVVVDLAGTSGTVTVTVTVTDCSGNVNSASINVASQTCFCSYTQGGWGTKCRGANPGCLLQAAFSAVYPSGLVTGNHGSPYTLSLTTVTAVRNFLPQGTTPGVLTKSLINPTSSPAGVLAGQVNALQITVDLDDADYLARIAPLPIGDLLVASGPFANLRVRDLLLLGNQVMGGNKSLLPAGRTVSDLNAAIDAVNRNFDNCKSSLGFLTRP